MSDHIIEVERLSKRYRLGEINTGTLSHDLNLWWTRTIKKTSDDNLWQANSTREHWSLKDVSFTVNKGDVLGVIGKNGAGKSTLLKLLSKITKPTSGEIRIGGRIGSLLEVGTGFHPDLTGRENVFLNGAILGMNRQEIKSKFDEIVQFSGIERFIDTPVKRYSSGMYVRLAFAVAAHLDPEILVIDEVLAVGDAEFQQKCLGKMKEVSKSEGRTILFVSHNASAVKQLCNNALMLEDGRLKYFDTVDKVLENYQENIRDVSKGKRAPHVHGSTGHFESWFLRDASGGEKSDCYPRENITLVSQFLVKLTMDNCEFHLRISTEQGQPLAYLSSGDFGGRPFSVSPGRHEFSFALKLPLRPGKYNLEFGFRSMGNWVDTWASSTLLLLLDNFETQLKGESAGLLSLAAKFNLEPIEELVNS